MDKPLPTSAIVANTFAPLGAAAPCIAANSSAVNSPGALLKYPKSL